MSEQIMSGGTFAPGANANVVAVDEVGQRRSELQKQYEAACASANFHASEAARQRALGRAAWAALQALDYVEPEPEFAPHNEMVKDAPDPQSSFPR